MNLKISHMLRLYKKRKVENRFCEEVEGYLLYMDLGYLLAAMTYTRIYPKNEGRINLEKKRKVVRLLLSLGKSDFRKFILERVEDNSPLAEADIHSWTKKMVERLSLEIKDEEITFF